MPIDAITPDARAARRIRFGLAATALLIASLPMAAAPASAEPASIGGLDTVGFAEGGDPVAVLPDVVVTGGGAFADGHLELAIDDATPHERLFLTEVTSPDPTAGAVSVVGGAIYLGIDGTDAKQLGTIDTTLDGQDGRPLRINFVAALPNADFSEGTQPNGDPVAWTVNRQQVVLGPLAAKTQQRPVSISGTGPYTVTGDGYSFVTDHDYTPTAAHQAWGREGDERALSAVASYTSEVTGHGGRSQVLRLHSSGGQCASPNANFAGPAGVTYCSSFGPDAWSSPFDASAGDDLALDWAAANGNDDYEVYGFLVDEADGTHHELLYGRGFQQGFTTASGVIPADGTYRFRFVAGSYDRTGGYVLGASLYIDNLRVLSSDADASVVQAVARLAQYHSTDRNPASTRTLAVATSSSEGVGSGQVTIEVELVDDPPELGEIGPVTYTNGSEPQTFPVATGAIPASDPEGDPLTFSAGGATADPTPVEGEAYTHSVAGVLGRLHLHATTGAYAFVPDDAVVNARRTPTSESFPVAVEANGRTDDGTLLVQVDVTTSVPGAPTITSITPGNRSLLVAFAAPGSDGGAAVVTYEYSVDGGATWSPRPAGTTASPLAVRPLANGVTYPVRLRAVNPIGPGPGSETVSSAPVLAPVAVPPATGGAEPGAPAGPGDAGTPSVPVGQVRLVVDGVPQPAEVRVVDGRWTLQGDGFTVELVGLDTGGASLEVDATGRLVVVAGSAVEVSGSGFLPGSTVDVWLFSTPTFLGEVQVGPDGTFGGRLPLPAAVAAGEHTVQLNGVAPDGSLRTASAGVVVIAPPAEPAPAGGDPVTGQVEVPVSPDGQAQEPAESSSDWLPLSGSDATPPTLLGLVLIAVGLGIVALDRWRAGVVAR